MADMILSNLKIGSGKCRSWARIPLAPPTSHRFEAFSGEVCKARAYSGDKHGSSAPERARTVRRWAPLSISSPRERNSVPMSATWQTQRPRRNHGYRDRFKCERLELPMEERRWPGHRVVKTGTGERSSRLFAKVI